MFERCHIRNAILRAAFRAAAASVQPSYPHYRDAVQLELRAQGKLVAHRPRSNLWSTRRDQLRLS